MYKFNTPISEIPGVGERYAKKLATMNIFSLADLLYHLPHRYDDFSVMKKINQVGLGETVTIQGQVESIKTIRTWKRKMSITEAYVKDDTGMIKAAWFNNPLPVKFLSKGKYVQISGTIKVSKKNEPHFQHPNFEIIPKAQFDYGAIKKIDDNNSRDNKNISTGSLVAIYPETKGVTSYWLRRLIKKVLTQTEAIDFMPADILKSQKLIDLGSALQQIHFPENPRQADKARKRFAFEKMFLIQLKSLQTKKDWQSKKAKKIKFDEKLIKKFVDNLPFRLTDAQKKSAWQIFQDLEKTTPMNRLLEGDVGSGKTVVAALAILAIINKKSQATLLAPTEVLAIQHYKDIQDFLKKHKFNIALLTASQKNINGQKVTKKILLEKLAQGKIDLVIGTHAILQDKVAFKNLALIIIDEQHRFGVNQRAYLQQQTSIIDDGDQKTIPHLLTMTATPIPRSLSLAIFGNLDLSIIDEMPKGRKQIITKVINKQGRNQVYGFIKKVTGEGQQVFIICPLVEESSKITEVKAATEEFERLQKKIFPEFKLGLLHGRKKPTEKNEIMNEFKKKKIDILVSTSVVEVGVDIPNASIMIIEGAERFGLSQLHQFRGRVGRGKHQSYCFLFTSENVADSTRRLNAMEKTNDGFKIAKEDLKLRGPGQFLGTMQSGLPDIAMESLSDIKSIQAARLEAQRIIAFDANLKKFPLLKNQLEKLESIAHWE
jgi:ATP-dependent DNA helicase RecG